MRKALTLLLAGALGVSAAARHAAQGGIAFLDQTPQPTFKTGVDAVVVDFQAVDGEGRFVRDLTKDDVRVFEDGREQAISTFDLVEIPVTPPEPVRFAGKPIDADVGTNVNAEGRIYVLVLDDSDTMSLRTATVRALAREFVENDLGPLDRVALTTTSGRSELQLEFTGDRRRLLDAIDKFQGGWGQGQPLTQLRALANWLSVRDRRKTIVLIGSGMPSCVFGISDSPVSWTRGCPVDLLDVIVAANRNNVSFYTIDPIGRPGYSAPGITPGPYLEGDLPHARTAGQDTLATLAAETGGRALIGSNDFTQAFDRIVEDASSYYLLGYASANAKRNGTFRQISVQIDRPGIGVHARSGYVPQSDKPRDTDVHPKEWTPELFRAIQSPVQISGLKMNVSAAAFRGSGSTASVEVVVETPESHLRFSAGGGRSVGLIDVAVVAADVDGHVKASAHGDLELSLSPATRDAVDQYGVRILSRLALKPGRYGLRVGGSDDVGAVQGSVHYTLDVPNFSEGPLTMSGIVLASDSEDHRPTTGSDKDWRRRFAYAPTATRSFASDDTLHVSGEIYRNDRNTGGIDVTTTVRNEFNEIVFRQQQDLPAAFSGTSASYPSQTTIPLKDVKPGNYLLTVEARGTANARASALREVLFSVR